MTRWNILEIAFYGEDDLRRIITFEPDTVNIVTGASGTGKSAIIDAIDYCLGSKDCGLPFFVREHAVAVAILWAAGDRQMIVGRSIPRAGKGTEQMYVRTGRNISLPRSARELEGTTNRETARSMIERSFGIDDIDLPTASSTQKGRASVRDVTPYIFLSADVIVSKTNLLHDLNRPEKARDIKATLPYFLGAVDQQSVLAERRLRQLQIVLDRMEREAKDRDRSQARAAERAASLLAQAGSVGVRVEPLSEEPLLDQLKAAAVILALVQPSTPSEGDELNELEAERQVIVRDLQELRDRRRTLMFAGREASGYSSTVSSQAHKLGLIQHLALADGNCPVCHVKSETGRVVADQIRSSLTIVGEEVLAVDRLQPEIAREQDRVVEAITSKAAQLREVEARISGIIKQIDEGAAVATLEQGKALLLGRIRQFLEMSDEDSNDETGDTTALELEIAALRDQVDPDAKRDRLRDAEIMIGNYATQMLGDLPSELPVRGSRMTFVATPRISMIEPIRRAALKLSEIGSDQNYLAIHLALAFSLQKHLNTIDAPVPGILVIDQISRPYYPDGGDEKGIEDIAKDSDRQAMRKIVRFLFDETARQSGLQVILIEHAFISDDKDYVGAVRERWTSTTKGKLIPDNWPRRVSS